MRKGRRYNRQETVSEFKDRLAAKLRANGEKPEKSYAMLLRPKGSMPTPSEVLGGAKMPRVMPKGDAVPKPVRDWLKGLGIKV